MSTRVSAALFDLGGVLLHFRGNGRAEAEKAVGLPPGTLRRIAYKDAFALANYGVAAVLYLVVGRVLERIIRP